MRFVFIILGACLLFTNLSLKASDLAGRSSEKAESYKQLEQEFPHLLQRISMYNEALQARDQGLVHVSSYLKTEQALRLRLSGLVEAWSDVEDKKSVIDGLSSFYDGLDQSQQLHREILAILNIQVGGGASSSNSSPASSGGGGGSAASCGGAFDANDDVRFRGQLSPADAIEQKTSDDQKYSFPEKRVISEFHLVQALQNLINHWYDGVALPNEEDKSSLGRFWTNVRRATTNLVNGADPDEILRRKLYFLAGNQGALLSPLEKEGRDLFLSFLLYKSAEEKSKTNRDWLPSFDYAVELFASDRFSASDNNFASRNAVLLLLQDQNMPAKWSTVRGTKGLKFWHVQLFAEQYQVKNQGIKNLRDFARDAIMSTKRDRKEEAYTLLNETLLERVPVNKLTQRYRYLVKARDQQALKNILAYSKDLDATYKKEGCRSCFGTNGKVARRNLRYLVEQFNKNHDKFRPLQDLLNTYQKNGVEKALENLKWKRCKNSSSIGSDVNDREIIIADAIWHENLNLFEASL